MLMLCPAMAAEAMPSGTAIEGRSYFGADIYDDAGKAIFDGDLDD